MLLKHNLVLGSRFKNASAKMHRLKEKKYLCENRTTLVPLSKDNRVLHRPSLTRGDGVLEIVYVI
jgi:hypothetical protein